MSQSKPQLSDLVPASDLSLSEMTLVGQRVLVAFSPAVASGELFLRFEAWRALDAEYVAREPNAQGLSIQTRSPAGHWRPLPLSSADPGITSLVSSWYDAILRFLYNDDPGALAEERAHAADWQRLSHEEMMDAIRDRADDRLFGRPQYGDLCVAQFGDPWDENASPIFQIIDPSPAGLLHSCYGIPLDGSAPFPTSKHISPRRHPFIRKLGSITLDFAPEPGINAHTRLKLLGIQARIDTARQDGRICHELITSLRKEAFGA